MTKNIKNLSVKTSKAKLEECAENLDSLSQALKDIISVLAENGIEADIIINDNPPDETDPVPLDEDIWRTVYCKGR